MTVTWRPQTVHANLGNAARPTLICLRLKIAWRRGRGAGSDPPWLAVVAALAMRAVLWAALGALLCEAVLDDTYYKTLGVPTDASTLQVRPCPALRHPTPSLRRCWPAG